MPEFNNPFSGTVPDRKLTLSELIRAIRLNISAEHEAVHLYMAHADATDNALARRVLTDVANEERVHIGEFMRLLEELAGDEAGWLDDGRKEVEEMIAGGAGSEELGPSESKAAEAGGVATGGSQFTVGSLRP
ncbi:MAG: ferritin family protein [Anaerolineae bacterium]